MNKQTGFTLIELVIVVVILGLLTATAIPKFLNLTDQAEQANIEGMAGGFATAISLARAQWEAEARPKNASSQNFVDYDGTTLMLTTENSAAGIRPGYVVGLTDGMTLAGDFGVENCLEIWRNILQQPPTISSTIADLNNDVANYFAAKSGTGATTECHFYLKDTLNRDASGFVSPGTSTGVGNSFTYQPANSSVIVYINQ